MEAKGTRQQSKGNKIKAKTNAVAARPPPPFGVQEAQSKLARARRADAPAGSAVRELQAECDALRKLINCNVCHQRQVRPCAGGDGVCGVGVAPKWPHCAASCSDRTHPYPQRTATPPPTFSPGPLLPAPQKDVVITKCWHMFCGECIRRNLETRHRKCPGCGAPFGQGDVKSFFFT